MKQLITLIEEQINPTTVRWTYVYTTKTSVTRECYYTEIGGAE